MHHVFPCGIEDGCVNGMPVLPVEEDKLSSELVTNTRRN